MGGIKVFDVLDLRIDYLVGSCDELQLQCFTFTELY